MTKIITNNLAEREEERERKPRRRWMWIWIWRWIRIRGPGDNDTREICEKFTIILPGRQKKFKKKEKRVPTEGRKARRANKTAFGSDIGHWSLVAGQEK